MLDKIRANTFCSHYMYIVRPLIYQYVTNVDYMISHWFILVRKGMPKKMSNWRLMKLQKGSLLDSGRNW